MSGKAEECTQTETTFDFGGGAVPAHRHTNPDGSEGAGLRKLQWSQRRLWWGWMLWCTGMLGCLGLLRYMGLLGCIRGCKPLL